MKKFLLTPLFAVCSIASAQFVPGQILTANQLNSAFSNVLPLTGGTLSGPFAVNGNTILSNLTVNGTFTVPGGFSPSSLAPQAPNSLLGNASGSTQAPGVIAMPSCSASGNALKWTSASGFTCGTGNALVANPLSQFSVTTSAQLAGIISDETGSGSLVFGTSPTLIGPALGTPISGIATNLTGTAAGLTAGNVTTNANLTGPITSIGNATTIGAGQVSLANIATEASNTIIGNATSGTASPSALSIASCSTTSSALIWTTNTGFGCSTSINAATLGGATLAAPGPIGSTTANTAAFTTLSASSTVSGAGFVSLLSPYLTSSSAASTYATIAQATTALAATGGSINGVTTGLTTPAASKVTTLQATSTITPSTTAGIVGTTLADNANAGSIGEYPTPTNLSGVSLTNNVAANVASMPLTAGDYDVSCEVQTSPAGSTVTAFMYVGVGTTSATIGTLGSAHLIQGTSTAGATYVVGSPTFRINTSSATTAYCVTNVNFSVSTMTASGYIRARRVR